MSTTTQRPTPETDAVLRRIAGGLHAYAIELRDKALSLERERDEARERAESKHGLWMVELSRVTELEKQLAATSLYLDEARESKDRISKRAEAIRCELVEKDKQLEAMREAIKEAHADIQSGHELWPVWVGTPTTMQVHQSMQSALAKLQPFLKT